MFAVVRTGGKQYRVAPGDKIVVEKLDGNAGDQVTLDDVLLAGDGSDLKSVDGLSVAAEIVAQAKGEKVTVFKKRRRHNYRRKKGHRQQHTILKIVAIGDQKAEKKPSKAKAEAPKAEGGAAEPKAAVAAPAKKAEAPAKSEKTSEASEKPKKAASKKPAAEKASTKNAAPAKGGANKSSKGSKAE